MGVSCAAPAYYADRLCDRARCYLREFFAPLPFKRDELETRRQKKEDETGLRKLLRAEYSKLTRAQKDQKRERAAKLRDQVEKELKQMTWDAAKNKFEGRDAEGGLLQNSNQDRTEKLSKTMYWM
jgi:eukaryotic translation initiation factor 2C